MLTPPLSLTPFLLLFPAQLYPKVYQETSLKADPFSFLGYHSTTWVPQAQSSVKVLVEGFAWG